jgi:hypothetical protein
VREFAELGPLPASTDSERTVARHQEWLSRITSPVTDEEAELLASCFGPDDCFGLAWTLLHIIESAPNGGPIKAPPADDENEWIKRLWARSCRR